MVFADLLQVAITNCVLNRQLNLRKKDVDISALIQAIFEKLSHVEQSTVVASILNQAINILLNE